MGHGGRRSGRRKGGRRHLKRKRRATSTVTPRSPAALPTPSMKPPPTIYTPSSDEEEEPTDYDLLLTVLGPSSKRLRLEEDGVYNSVGGLSGEGVKGDTGGDESEAGDGGDESEAGDGVESEDGDGVEIEAVDGDESEAGDGVESGVDDGVESGAGDGVESGVDDGVESKAGDGVESGVGDGMKDSFKVHFEQVLTDQQVERLEQSFHHPPTYTQCEDPVLGVVEQVSPLPERAGIIETPVDRNCLLKRQLRSWYTAHQPSTLQQHLFSVFNSYKDMLYMRRTFDNGEEVRRAYLTHVLNHVLRTRSRVLKNNARLAQAAKNDKQLDDINDQGLTRPKVLILLPFRECALRTVNMMVELLFPSGEGQVSHRKRFQEEFREEDCLPSKTKKPRSYEQMFAGNIDDCFRVGVALKRNIVKLYSEFYSSDIILASPLGLRTIIGARGDKKRDYDFLSSIEVLIVDQCDVFLMQNWDHLLHIFSHLHLTPRESHGVDISRLREWSVNGWSKYYRQTLVFSSFFTPEINALFNNHCFNYAGRVRVGELAQDGCISQVIVQTPQVFHRVPCVSYKQLPEARLSYFVEKILPDFSGELTKQTAIFIPSYFDFVRVRNHMKRAELSYCLLSEYTKTSQVSRVRSQFYHKQRHFLLYTERLHFFRRYHLRGIHHIIFYSLPLYHEFYPELVNMLEEVGQMGGVTCTVLYSRYELHMLSRIVGSVRARMMLDSDEHVHMVVMGT